MDGNFDVRNALHILQQFGINPAEIAPEKLERLNQLGLSIRKPEDITEQVASEMRDILGIRIEPPRNNTPKKRVYRIGRNEQCPCKSGFKYKKCCWLTGRF